MNIEKWLVPAIIFLSLSIAFSGIFIGKSFSAVNQLSQQVITEKEGNDDIISLTEAAVYLKIPENKLKFLVDYSISTDGKGIPYYKMNNDIMFSKMALSKWVVHNAENRLDY